MLAAGHDDLTAAGLDESPDVDPSLLACAQLSLSTTAASQPRVVDAPRLCVDAFDMSLHAATCVDGRDRKRLQRLARYLLRPPFALDALSGTDDGRVRLDIGRQGRAVTMTPQQWLALLSPDGSPAWTAAPLGETGVGGPVAHDVSRQRRLSWARLLARVFSTDVTTCPCGGWLRPLGAVLTPNDIAAHLHGARAPPRPAPHGQLSLLP